MQEYCHKARLPLKCQQISNLNASVKTAVEFYFEKHITSNHQKPQTSKQSGVCKWNTGSFILFESFFPLNYILEVFRLTDVSLHIFCYLHLEFLYQNLLHFSQAWDSTKIDYWHSLQHTIFAAFTFPYAFIRDNNAEISSDFLSVCSFRCKGNHSKEVSISRFCKNNLHSFILKYFFEWHI